MGCSQICGGTDEDDAIVRTGDGYECRRLDKQDEELAVSREEAPDLGFSAVVYACYEAAEDEAIVGVLHYERDEESDSRFAGPRLNPNDCAAEYYESKKQIVSDPECDGYDELRTDCIGPVFDSEGERRAEIETTTSA